MYYIYRVIYIYICIYIYIYKIYVYYMQYNITFQLWSLQRLRLLDIFPLWISQFRVAAVLLRETTTSANFPSAHLDKWFKYGSNWTCFNTSKESKFQPPFQLLTLQMYSGIVWALSQRTALQELENVHTSTGKSLSEVSNIVRFKGCFCRPFRQIWVAGIVPKLLVENNLICQQDGHRLP